MLPIRAQCSRDEIKKKSVLHNDTCVAFRDARRLTGFCCPDFRGSLYIFEPVAAERAELQRDEDAEKGAVVYLRIDPSLNISDDGIRLTVVIE